MLDYLNTSPYFISLPALMQETITQSGVEFATDDELRQFVENMEMS